MTCIECGGQVQRYPAEWPFEDDIFICQDCDRVYHNLDESDYPRPTDSQPEQGRTLGKEEPA